MRKEKPKVIVRARHLPPLMNFNFLVQVGKATITNEVNWLRANAKARILAKAIHGDSRKYEVVDLWKASER